MTSILVENDNDKNNNNVNIINTIKQKALKPTPWTLKHLNIDNENNNNNISRLETIFLRFLYQYEHILLRSINENSNNNNNIELHINIYSYILPTKIPYIISKLIFITANSQHSYLV